MTTSKKMGGLFRRELRWAAVHRLWSLAAVLLLGCATAADDPMGTTAKDATGESAIDTSVTAEVAVDTSAPREDAEIVDVDPGSIFPVEDVAPPGTCGVPMGTKATASATGGANVPANAIDGKSTTFWGSGSTSGTLHLNFPSLVSLDRVRVQAWAWTSSVAATFTVSGRVGETTTVIGTKKLAVTSKVTWLPELEVTAGGYDGVDIAFSSPTPLSIAEVYVYDSGSGCTPP